MSDAAGAIGVFDSGVGGLTVLSALRRRLPGRDLVYLGDTARVPYGTRSAEAVIRYALNNARTLCQRARLELLVVACNTASAVALPALRRALPIPVVGVIEPGARAAQAVHRGGGIAVLSTAGTARSGAYGHALAALGVRAEVVHQPCPLLVPLVEEGWLEGDITDRVLDRYLEALPAGLDTVILGCTHYPLLRPAFTRALARRGLAAAQIVDGADATALEVATMVCGSAPAPTGSTRFFVTDAPEKMAALAPRFLGMEVAAHDVEGIDVDMSTDFASHTAGTRT